MRTRTIYALLTIIGIVLPFSQFIPWLLKYGLNLSLFFQSIIQSPLATFAWLDVSVTVAVIVFLVIHDGKNLKMTKLWIPVTASLIGGASVGLPLFLYMRQSHLDKLEYANLSSIQKQEIHQQ